MTRGNAALPPYGLLLAGCLAAAGAAVPAPAAAAAPPSGQAAHAEQAFGESVDATLERLRAKTPGSAVHLGAAKGLLVCPEVVKVGYVIGGEYGNCALRVAGQTVAYYNLLGASVGALVGVQSAGVVLAFENAAALDRFRHSDGWQAGVDGNIALFKAGAGGALTTQEAGPDIVGFVVDPEGLMLDLSLSGSKFTRVSGPHG